MKEIINKCREYVADFEISKVLASKISLLFAKGGSDPRPGTLLKISKLFRYDGR